MARMWILAAVIACRLQLVESKGFLAQHGSFIMEEVEHTLMMELPLSGDKAQLLSYRTDLRPMYETLPKNEFGRLSYATVRYALHRYFVYKHGWYVKGLDPEGKAWNASLESGPSKSATSYIVELFQKRFHWQGLDLEGLAAFAATLSDLIFGEGVKALEEIYDSFGFPLHGVTPPGGFDLVMRGYLAVVTIGDTAELISRADIPELETEAASVDPSYPDTVMWLQDLRRSHDWRLRSQSNPFIKSGVSWDRATEFMRRFLHNMGGIMKKECNSLKDAMVDMEQGDSGRVAISTFYRNNELQVHESVAYLRNQGSLEERSGQTNLVIPNYINSPSRCLPFSGYFSVCCPNNCESLLDSVERAVSSPTATPSKLTEVVSHLSSDTVAAPRNLSVLLMARLDQIAAVHQGMVPLNGRLFAQWMHHVFPRECPFPHVSGTINAASQEQWLDMHEEVDSIRATDEEKDLHIAVVNHTEADVLSLPWTEEEELVSSHFDKQNSPGLRSGLRPIMAVMLIASFAYPLSRSCMKLGPDGDKAAKPVMSQHGVLV